MMETDPFGYSLQTYSWVVGVASFASVVRHLNSRSKTQRFDVAKLLTDVLSGGFTGLLTFWLCESRDIKGPTVLFLIGMSGLMGNRALQDFANLLRMKFGLPPTSQPSVDLPVTPPVVPTPDNPDVEPQAGENR